MIPTYLGPVANHLWQSTLFAGLVFLLSLTLRRHRAQVRCWLWLAASVKFLVPFSLLLSAGARVDWKPAQAVAVPVSIAIAQASQPFPVPIHVVGGPPVSVPSPVVPALWFLAWFTGCVSVSIRWWKRWRTVRSALRESSTLDIAGPVEVRSSAARLEPGIFGVFRPVLLVPDGIADRLTPEQFEAILAHEFCHVRRHDNLYAALHMVVEAIFWFHPLTWWIGSRLVEERERACDEDVLRQGSNPEVYAAGILRVCRFYLESPLPCAAGVTGADLKKRVSTIMTGPMVRLLTPVRKALLAGAGLVALACPIAVGMLNQARAQAQAGTPLRFEVASIKHSDSMSDKFGFRLLPGDGLKMDGVTLRALVAFAYGVEDGQVIGGPKWVGSDSYDILAKGPGGSTEEEAMKAAPGSTTWNRVRQRMQSLLKERFQLEIHDNGKEAQGYELRVAKGGSKLQDGKSMTPPGTMRSRGRIDGRNGSMTMLAAVLTNYMGHPVVDKTGLTGSYDYKLEYAQENFGGGRGGDFPEAKPTDIAAPSLLNALEEQLGLRLEKAKVLVPSIVIDRAEKASEN